MNHPVVEISGLELIGRDQFHDTFARLFGFPAYYGRNMDAWLDCMSCLRTPQEALSSLHVEEGKTLTLLIHDHESLRDSAPQQWNDLIECAAFANSRELKRGEGPILAFAF